MFLVGRKLLSDHLPMRRPSCRPRYPRKSRRGIAGGITDRTGAIISAAGMKSTRCPCEATNQSPRNTLAEAFRSEVRRLPHVCLFASVSVSWGHPVDGCRKGRQRRFIREGSRPNRPRLAGEAVFHVAGRGVYESLDVPGKGSRCRSRVAGVTQERRSDDRK